MISFALSENGEASCHALVLPRRWEEALATLVPLGLTKLHETQLEGKAVIERSKPSHKGFTSPLSAKAEGLEVPPDGGLGTLRTRLLIFLEKVANLLCKSLATFSEKISHFFLIHKGLSEAGLVTSHEELISTACQVPKPYPQSADHSVTKNL